MYAAAVLGEVIFFTVEAFGLGFQVHGLLSHTSYSTSRHHHRPAPRPRPRPRPHPPPPHHHQQHHHHLPRHRHVFIVISMFIGHDYFPFCISLSFFCLLDTTFNALVLLSPEAKAEPKPRPCSSKSPHYTLNRPIRGHKRLFLDDADALECFYVGALGGLRCRFRVRGSRVRLGFRV